ncbi:MAG: stage V sporulation protein AB [Christensenellales bacterium]
MLDVVSAVIGFTWGIAIGSAAIAIVTVLNIFPRLLHLFDAISAKNMRICGAAFAIGCVVASFSSLSGFSLGLDDVAAVIVSLLYGVYIGFLVSSLTEVLDLFPPMASGLNPKAFVAMFVLVLAVSKIAGSLLWFIKGI